jgi:hypothetical protein
MYVCVHVHVPFPAFHRLVCLPVDEIEADVPSIAPHLLILLGLAEASSSISVRSSSSISSSSSSSRRKQKKKNLKKKKKKKKEKKEEEEEEEKEEKQKEEGSIDTNEAAFPFDRLRTHGAYCYCVQGPHHAFVPPAGSTQRKEKDSLSHEEAKKGRPDRCLQPGAQRFDRFRPLVSIDVAEYTHINVCMYV